MRHWFIGWDPRDDLAAKVLVRSMQKRSHGITIHWLKDHELRRAGLYWRSYEVHANGQRIDHVDGKPFSTDFSFSRFVVPELARRMGIHEPVLFTDADFMWRANLNHLFDLWDDTKTVMCVQHNHQPREATKFDGLEQPRYFRKNWSSLMLMHPDRTAAMDLHKLNNWNGSNLHALLWAQDDAIGALPPGWNHLVGYDSANPDALGVHFTLGTPDIPGRGMDEHSDEWRSYVLAGEMPEDYSAARAGTMAVAAAR